MAEQLTPAPGADRVEIVGASGPPCPADEVLAAAKAHLAATTAVLDPGRVAGPDHLQASADHAARALTQDRAISRDPSMEVLLYAAGVDQIQAALARVGLSGQVQAVALVALADDAQGVDAFLDAIGFHRDDAAVALDAERAVELARDRGHPATVDDAVDWLIEDAALVALGSS